MLTKNTTVDRPCLCWQYAAQAPPPPPLPCPRWRRALLMLEGSVWLSSNIVGREKWDKMCNGVSQATPFSQLLLFQAISAHFSTEGRR